MKWFDYARPYSIGEAVQLLSGAGDKARVLAGGTDLLVQLRADRKQAELVVDVKRIPEMNEIRYQPEKGLELGAAVPCYQIYRNPLLKEKYPALVDVASIIGGTQIQGRASIGGNLCNAAPSADSIPLLIALGVRCRIAGVDGEREVPVEQFCTGPGRSILKPGELLLSLQFAPPGPGKGACYIRFIPRNEMDIAVAGAGVGVELDNGLIRSARIALASVAPIPLFVPEAGAALAGVPVSDDAIQRAADIAKEAAKPITDMRGTVDYRRHLCGVLVRRALHAAIRRAKETR